MMSKWVKTCEEFVIVREAIDREDYNAIMHGLLAICKKYAEEDWEWKEEFGRMAEELEIDVDDDLDEETVEYYLNDFYNLCDAARVWCEIG